MAQSRSISELLIVLKENKKRFRYGLCVLIDELESEFIITYAESIKLHNYLVLYHPKTRNLPHWESRVGYYWPISEWSPRLQWINYHIKKLSK
jgi:hypothetical protein